VLLDREVDGRKIQVAAVAPAEKVAGHVLRKVLHRQERECPAVRHQDHRRQAPRVRLLVHQVVPRVPLPVIVHREDRPDDCAIEVSFDA